MKLYDLKAGMNPRRVRIFLAEKGIEIPRVEVDMAKANGVMPQSYESDADGLLEYVDGVYAMTDITV